MAPFLFFSLPIILLAVKWLHNYQACFFLQSSTSTFPCKVIYPFMPLLVYFHLLFWEKVMPFRFLRKHFSTASLCTQSCTALVCYQQLERSYFNNNITVTSMRPLLQRFLRLNSYQWCWANLPTYSPWGFYSLIVTNSMVPTMEISFLRDLKCPCLHRVHKKCSEIECKLKYICYFELNPYLETHSSVTPMFILCECKNLPIVSRTFTWGWV